MNNQTASIDIDAQYSFTPSCPDELPVPDGNTIVDELNLQASFTTLRLGTKDAHCPTAIWVADDKHPPLSPINHADHCDTYWPVHCVPGTFGFTNLNGLPHPSDYDFFIWKGIEPDMHPYGACFHDLKEQLSTGIIEYLRSNHVLTVVVGGLATDYCVKTTVLQLLRADFSCIVNLGACRGITPATTEKALREMEKAGATLIKSAKEL